MPSFLNTRFLAGLAHVALAAMLAAPAAAQQPQSVPDLGSEPSEQAPAGDQFLHSGRPWSSPFAPLRLSSPNAYRQGDGRPGQAYWQQHADYAIEATFDPAADRISGKQIIRYRNNSPDSLAYVWLQLDQNRFRPGSRGDLITPIGGRFEGRGQAGGIEVTSFRAAGTTQELARDVRDTRMRVELDQSLPPGGEAVWELAWSFPVPRYGADRMGIQDVSGGEIYEIAQWYPRMAVYDDVKGWNNEPYLGVGEFYLEYGDFDVKLTAPREYIVAATGTLLNPEQVLTPEQLQRLDRARTSEQTIAIVGPDDVGKRSARPAGDGPLTWHFEARNVRDFAWAASRTFIWDAASWDGVLAQSVYPREALPLWSGSTQMVRESLRLQSRWYRYPYPSMTNVNGVAGGMEYPMMVFCGERRDERALWEVTNHEIGHTWFPMIVGSNERLNMWQDEGFNTFINGFATASRYDEPLTPRVTVQKILPYVAGNDQPPMMRSDAIEATGIGPVAYDKPSVGLHLLREQVIGDTLLFDAAFKGYIQTWAYKHPTPEDFFRYMSSALGENLDWFWRGWFLTNDKLDLQVTDVDVSDAAGGGKLSVVRLRSNGDMVFPVPLELTFDGGEKRRVTLPVEAWLRGPRFDFPVVDPKAVVGVRIDPDGALPDLVADNNSWSAESPKAPAGESPDTTPGAAPTPSPIRPPSG
ncbi:MAG TPA: M1 family metallopeptidase [Gemmatimonadota bacterium]